MMGFKAVGSYGKTPLTGKAQGPGRQIMQGEMRLKRGLETLKGDEAASSAENNLRNGQGWGR